MKNYEVNVDLGASFTYRIRARTAADAKKKAFEKFRKDRSVRRYTNFYVDRYDEDGYPV